jgi:hypothetical protein
MSCSPSISRAVIAGSFLALAACAGSLDHPERFANLGAFPDAGTVTSSSDGGCDPVVDIFPLSCATSACHSAQSQQGNLDLESFGLPGRLVNKRANGGPGLLIDSANPPQSVMLTKATDTPPFGFQMPLGQPPLPPDQLACLQAWVTAAVTP